jgi:uncharacterized peroxidase-related enzyme
MWHIQPIANDEAQGTLLEMYEQDPKNEGYIWNTTQVRMYRPEMLAQWRVLQKAVRAHLRLRTYELVTLAAARAMGCTYCMLVHGGILRKNGFTAEQVIAILGDPHNAGLSPEEVHLMDYAAKISGDSKSITQAHTDRLRQDGLSDQQITDVALAAVMRNFLSRFFDALGADPDPDVIAREPELWAYLKGLEQEKPVMSSV